jgi:hypothetical protein
MRRAFILLVLLIVALAVVDYWRDHQHDEDSYMEQLEHTLACADWRAHDDPTFGYRMRYPSCFVPASTEGEAEGTVRFAYVEEMPLRQIAYITLETTTQVCRDSLNPYREMRQMAKDMGGICLRQSDTEYLLSAKLQSRNPHVTAFRMNAKYVLRQKLWFVETLIYPEDFAPSVQRIVKEVNEWTPFE